MEDNIICTEEITDMDRRIEQLTFNKPPGQSNHVNPCDDFCCMGLVKTICWVERRLFKIPFQTCTISHSSIVCETTRGKAYLVEYCEFFDTLVHDITEFWSFTPAKTFKYAGYTYKRELHPFKLPIVSFNVQFLAKLFQNSADLRGDYILSGNNCHYVQEEVRYSLGICSIAEAHYSGLIEKMDIGFDCLKEMKPFNFM
uniref:Uncharacterized protein n=1 Tax=Trepomonas sp. PC1 TaxID=1076344 RepID=A0A146K2U3_9EUKA|eukprot:JAP91212.1 Hypothetical protein TPC1_17241 [Trepomonas sp. PC1]